MRQSKKLNNGFSLIEVMVAMFITSIIVSSVYFSFSNLMSGRERLKNRTEYLRRVYFSLDVMKRDIENAYLTNNKGTPEQTHITIFKGEEDNPVSHLTFSTVNHMRMRANTKECDQSEVEYFTGQVDGKNTLMRRESFWVDEFPEKGGNVYPVLSDFISIKFEYWDATNLEWKSEWNSESLDQADSLPPKVKITMEIAQESEERKEFKIETIVTIKMTKPYTN